MAAKRKRKKPPVRARAKAKARGKSNTKGRRRSNAAPTKKSGPVARVWQLASSMPRAARKDVVAACVNAGVNIHTAKTQYQRWSHRNK